MEKLKNPYFWLSVFALIFSAAGIDFETLTSWQLLVQALVGNETYVKMLDKFYVQILLHFVLIINTWFILKGEKYYNENVGVE